MTRDKVQELFHDHDVVKAGVRMLHAMVAMSKLVADSDFADAVEAVTPGHDWPMAVVDFARVAARVSIGPPFSESVPAWQSFASMSGRLLRDPGTGRLAVAEGGDLMSMVAEARDDGTLRTWMPWAPGRQIQHVNQPAADYFRYITLD